MMQDKLDIKNRILASVSYYTGQIIPGSCVPKIKFQEIMQKDNFHDPDLYVFLKKYTSNINLEKNSDNVSMKTLLFTRNHY